MEVHVQPLGAPKRLDYYLWSYFWVPISKLAVKIPLALQSCAYNLR